MPPRRTPVGGGARPQPILIGVAAIVAATVPTTIRAGTAAAVVAITTAVVAGVAAIAARAAAIFVARRPLHIMVVAADLPVVPAAARAAIGQAPM